VLVAQVSHLVSQHGLGNSLVEQAEKAYKAANNAAMGDVSLNNEKMHPVVQSMMTLLAEIDRDIKELMALWDSCEEDRKKLAEAEKKLHEAKNPETGEVSKKKLQKLESEHQEIARKVESKQQKIAVKTEDVAKKISHCRERFEAAKTDHYIPTAQLKEVEQRLKGVEERLEKAITKDNSFTPTPTPTPTKEEVVRQAMQNPEVQQAVKDVGKNMAEGGILSVKPTPETLDAGEKKPMTDRVAPKAKKTNSWVASVQNDESNQRVR
jgi:chromosome segregation ATPase